MTEAQLISWMLTTEKGNYNLLEKNQSEIALHELSQNKFIVRVQGAHQPKLVVGDFEIALKHESLKEDIHTFISDEIQCFKNFIGLAQAELFFKDRINVYTSIPINIYARKITYERALSFLKMIAEKSDISAMCFSVTKLNSDSNRSSRNITAMLNAGINALDYFQQNRGRFAQFPCSKTKTISKTQRYSESTHLDDRSIAYLCHHPDTLQPSLFSDRDVSIGSRNFKINQIETSSFIKDTDILENQIIAAFIRNFTDYLKDLGVRLAGNKLSAKPLIQLDGETYLSIDRLLKDSGLILSFHEEKINFALDKCRQCMKFIQEKIPCKIIRGANVAPIPTQQVLARTHYLQLFNLIKNYYEIGEPQWRGQLEFFGLRNLYKIYEFVCLIFLIDSLKKNGFAAEVAQYIGDDFIPVGIRPENEPCNYYVFQKDQIKVELFYEPKSIYARQLKQSTQHAFLVDLVHERYQTWSPDFALKVSSGDIVSTHLFDSKYSNYRTVQESHLPQCAFKYTTKMACIKKDKIIRPVDSLTILYSDLRTGYESFYASAVGLYTDSGQLNEQLYSPIVGMMPLHEDNASELPKLINDLTICTLNNYSLSP